MKPGRLNWKFLGPLKAVFDASYPAPPKNVAPGKYSFAVTITGTITGEPTQQYLTVDVIPLPNDRWDRSAVGTRQSCNDPIGTEPISCTPPSKATGTLTIDFPSASKPGERFSFAVGALNCTACAIRYEYVSR